MSQIEVYNPFTLERVFSQPAESYEAVAKKIAAAQAASRAWGQLPPEERSERVMGALSYFRDHRREVAEGITREVGKPLQAAADELDFMLERAEYLCRFAREGALTAVRHPAHDDETFEGRLACRPKGVVYIISPWNYPLFCAINGTVCALLAGNAVVLKHTTTPSVGAHFERAFAALGGISPLLVHAVVDFAVSARIIEEADVNHVVFTGSVEGGRTVQQSVAKRAFNDVSSPFIQCSLELGGSDGAYVAADADLDEAVSWTVKVGRLHNSGQSCCAIKRVYVHEHLYEDFLDRAQQVMEAEKNGDPMERETTLGPLHGGESVVSDLLDMVREAEAGGARICTGGETERVALVDFLKPTLLADVRPGMRVLRDETFGPVLPVMKVQSDGEAVEQLRASRYGLTSAIFTTSRARAERFIAGLDTGTVYVNRCNFVDARLGWIGHGHSGNGAISLSPDGLRAFSARKSINVDPRRLKGDLS